MKFFAILKPMPHLGQLTVEGFFVTSTRAPQSLQMMRALIETVAACLSFFASAMASPFPVTDFYRLEASVYSHLKSSSCRQLSPSSPPIKEGEKNSLPRPLWERVGVRGPTKSNVKEYWVFERCLLYCPTKKCIFLKHRSMWRIMSSVLLRYSSSASPPVLIACAMARPAR